MSRAIREREKQIDSREDKIGLQRKQIAELRKLQNVIKDQSQQLSRRSDAISQLERENREFERLIERQDDVTNENVEKIQLIEATIDEVERVVNEKDNIIKSLRKNINRYRNDAVKEAGKIDDLEEELDERTKEVI